jgi:hypothetical protein
MLVCQSNLPLSERNMKMFIEKIVCLKKTGGLATRRIINLVSESRNKKVIYNELAILLFPLDFSHQFY